MRVPKTGVYRAEAGTRIQPLKPIKRMKRMKRLRGGGR
jgi:hypothetical protein